MLSINRLLTKQYSIMSKTKKGHSKTNKEALQLFRGLITNKQKVLGRVSQIRESSPMSLFVDLVKLIRTQPDLLRAVFGQEFPESPQQLRNTRVLKTISAEREFRWAGARLLVHGAELQEFRQLSEEMERAILLGDYQTCERVLKIVQKKFGYSLWLIKNKIAFLQLLKGLEAQKQYTASVRQNSDGFISYITFYISMRNETTVSPNRFSTRFNEDMHQLELPGDVVTYLQYHIDPLTGLTPEELGDAIRFEASTSIIDYYETIIRTAQIAVANKHTNLYSAIAATIEPLQKVVSDRRIDFLLFQIKNDHPLSLTTINQSVIEVFDCFLRGDYSTVFQSVSELIATEGHNFDLLELAACAASMSNENMNETERSLAVRLVRSMKAMIEKHDEFGADFSFLIKISTNFSAFAWANSVWGFVTRQIASLPQETNNSVQRFATIAGVTLNPLRISAFSDSPEQSKYATAIAQLHGSSLASSFANAMANELTSAKINELSSEETTLLEASRAWRAGQFSKALSLSNELINTAYTYYRQSAVRLKSDCLLKLNKIAECVSFITSVFITEPGMWYIIPIPEVVAVIDKSLRRELSANVSLSILYDLHSRFVDNSKDNLKRYAYEDFLFAHGIERPSELLDVSLLESNTGKFLYFLRYLCVESVMDSSIVFSGSREVAEERLKICRILVDLDPESAEAYQDEIKTILRRLMIQKRMREIEQSKIYVDVDGIKQRAESTLRENFARLISFVKNKVYADFATKLKEAVKLADTTSFEKMIVIVLPENEMLDIFERMVIELRDEFVSNSVHGLDGYLSVRIRHGTLEGQLRKPLEEANLITERDSITNTYKPNTYWIERLGILDDQTRNHIVNCLANFAKQFDELVQIIKTEWIQIKKDNKDEGLFDFRLNRTEIALLSTNISEDTRFEDFVDRVITEFFLILEENLETVRYKLNNTAKVKVNDLLIELQTEIDQLDYYVETSDLSNAITATRTGMQNVFNRVIEWFRLSQSTAEEPLLLEEAISISEESVKTASHGFDVEISLPEEESIVLAGNRQINFVDILFIIFENVIKHSRLERPKAFVTVTKLENAIRIFIENEVADYVFNESNHQRIERIKSAMKEDNYIKSVTTEGGTGFHKIWKILAHDMRAVAELDFGFNENQRFYVEFTIPVREISHENFNS